MKLILVLIFCWCIDLHAQTEVYRFAFYNFENLFDTYDDSLTRDEEFTPEGIRHWNTYKYYHKLDQLSRVVAQLGDWSNIDVLGFCEVENRYCVEDLLNRDALKREKFGISYAESEDRRGIDVGLLFNKERFKLLKEENIKVRSEEIPSFRTRDILHSTLLSDRGDTIDFFVNHWPSKYRGKLESEPLRLLASQVLSKEVNELLKERPNAKVVCMGDFNDDREETSIKSLQEKTGLINAFSNYRASILSHKYQGNWSLIDQMFISRKLEDSYELRAFVYEASYLLEEDTRFLGLKPKRTFIGMRYNKDGFSDHLPVFIQLLGEAP